MRFYLGTHKPAWLGQVDVPLMVSRRSLEGRRSLPRALAPWVLDSGGFTELRDRGQWTVEPARYIDEVRRYDAEIGQLDWAAPQDWMVEPFILERTGGTVALHQAATVDNFGELRAELGSLVIPVLQGQTTDHYLDHIEQYRQAGVDLTAERTVGVGSVCRRQATAEIGEVLGTIAGALPAVGLHGFGVKMLGLRRYGPTLGSADSAAWSYHARRRAPLPGHSHGNCANCVDYALAWRSRMLNEGTTP